jgi:hypothetical protein
MASRGKKKTTMAKLTRESRLRERRQDKQARKNARKRAAALGESAEPLTGEDRLIVPGGPDAPFEDEIPAVPEVLTSVAVE